MAVWEHKEEFWEVQKIEYHNLNTIIQQWVKENERGKCTTNTITRKQ